MAVVVGDGTQRHSLDRLAEQLGVARYVRITGLVQHSEVKNYMRMADVFMSLYDLSNRGNPLLEAMVHGRCIVTINDGSVSDLIVDGQTGMLVEPGDIDDGLPKILVRLLKDGDMRRQLGEAARLRAHEKLMTVEERMGAEVEAIERLARNS